MLTGVYPPTYGDIYVDGVSAVQSPTIIQDNCGVCNQVQLMGSSDVVRLLLAFVHSSPNVHGHGHVQGNESRDDCLGVFAPAEALQD